MSADPTYAPVGSFHYVGVEWQWQASTGRLLPITSGERVLLDEIVRLRRMCADARIEAEHWWHEAVTR